MTITGLAEMERKYTRTFPQKLRVAIQRAMGEATEKVVQDMRARAPVYSGPPDTRGKPKGPVIPGALRASIGWTFGDAPEGAVTLGSINEETGDEVIKVSIFVGGKGPLGDAFYARWVEHGTKNWAGKPFFFGTWRDHRRRWRSAVTRAIRNEIRKAANV